MILLFPLGLLLLLTPHRWQCRACGNSIVSARNPGAPPSLGQILCTIATILLIPAAAAVIYVALTGPSGFIERVQAENAERDRAEARRAEEAAAAKSSKSVAGQAAELQRRQRANR